VKATFENWDPSHVNDPGNCAVLQLDKGGNWRPYDCNNAQWFTAYVCEFGEKFNYFTVLFLMYLLLIGYYTQTFWMWPESKNIVIFVYLWLSVKHMITVLVNTTKTCKPSVNFLFHNETMQQENYVRMWPMIPLATLARDFN